MQNHSDQICNISGKDVEKRRNIGILGFILSIIMIIIILILNLSPILVFPFVFISAIGFLQAYYKYCVAVGLCTNLKEHKKFKKEIFSIFKIILFSVLISVSVTVFLAFIPSL